LGLVVALAAVGVLVVMLGARIFGGFMIGGHRWLWLTVNAGVFVAASIMAWRIIYPRF
jgi:hypothetical protein